MEPSQKKRIQTSLEDIPTIREISNGFWEELHSDLPLFEEMSAELKFLRLEEDYKEDPGFPKKLYFHDSHSLKYCLVVSDLGSVTLLPEFGKKQPIFYMSLGKYGEGDFQWEDANGNLVSPHDLPKHLEGAVFNLRKYSQ